MEAYEQEKMEALRTVLPLIHEWIEVFNPIGSGWDFDSGDPDEEEELIDPHDARLIDRIVHEPEHEGWERVQMGLRRAYRLDVVWDFLEKLFNHPSPYARTVACAVYSEYVEPWEEWEPEWRFDLAEIGLLWMARKIPGEIPSCEAGKRETWRAKVKVLHAKGYGIRQIAKMTGHDRRSVRAALRNTDNSHRRKTV